MLGSKAPNGDEPEGLQPRAPPSQRQEKPAIEAQSKDKNRRPSKVISIHDDEESSGSHNDEEVNKKKEQPLDDDYEVALGDGDDKCKMEELLEALKKVKANKKSKAELTVKSPFTKRVRESPLPRIYMGVGDLSFNRTTDPVEYLSRFDTEIRVTKFPTSRSVAC